MLSIKKARLLLTGILFTIFISQAISQDIIRLANNDLIVAKNIIVSPEIVTYENFNDDDNKKYSLTKSEIASITYKDGSDIKFVTEKGKINNLNLGKNLINFHLFDFVLSNLTISYEILLAEGKYGIQIPISIGYKDETTSLPLPLPFDSDYTNKLVSKFSTGINFNIYPTGQGKFKYLLGPGLLVGDGIYHDTDNSYSSTYEDPYNTGFFKLYLNNGIIFTPVNNLSISAIGSIGIQYMTNSKLKNAETAGAFSLNLSLRF